MTLENTKASYGQVARFFHWSIAVLIAAVIPLGILANDMAHELEADPQNFQSDAIEQTIFLFSLHKTIGVLIFFLALARITWAILQPKPKPLHPERRLETVLAETVHWLLYGSLVMVPLTGWVSHAAQPGFAPLWGPFPDQLSMVPQSLEVKETAASLHIILERVMIVAIVLHVAGALKHAIVDKDATLARMWRGAAASAQAIPGVMTRAVFAPFILAIALWGTAIGAGSWFGLFETESHEVSSAVPLGGVAAASSAPVWMVQDAMLQISVLKNGSAITGRFETFDTEIRFDPETGKGAVDVLIDVASLAMGADTRDAISPPFLDATQHPGARFYGAIMMDPAGSGYIINGDFRLKGMAMPLPLRFDLEIDGDTASATGRAVIDRRNFGVGDNIDSADTLGFEVEVTIAVTAQRQR